MEADRSTAEAAVGHLFAVHSEQLLRMAVLLTGDRQVAEELVQEAFAHLWQRWPSLHDQAASLGYLRVTLVNLARSSFRRRALELRHRVVPAATVGLLDMAVRVDVLRALARLPMRKRACLVLRFYADLSEMETARLLGVSVGTVKSQTHRGLARLGQLLKDSGEAPTAAAPSKGRR